MMNKVLIGLCIGFVVLSCSKKKEIKNESLAPYIISKEDRELQEELKRTGKELLVHFNFYAANEILIDSVGNLFHRDLETPKYSENTTSLCGNGLQNDTIPEFINLQPKDLVELPNNSIEKYITQTILSKPKNHQVLIMASQSDTIKNKRFLKFLQKIKIPTYLIRRTTQEEDTVLYYKKENKVYLSSEIKWDSTKIKFPKK